MNITIYDIAQKCHVSIATVSRVLNGSSRVSEKTRAKVLQVMKEMGYKQSVCTRIGPGFHENHRRHLYRRRRYLLCHAVSLLEDGLRQHHFDVMLSNTGSDNGHNGKYISDMTGKHVDAIITIGTPFSSESDVRLLCETARQIPVITINSDYHQPVCTASSVMKKTA